NYANSLDPTVSSRPTKVEVPKELPKVSMVNMSLKKLKHHLASFDMVDLFNTFDQYLIDELFEVQNVFHQMQQAVEQHRNASVNVHECEKCLKLKTELLNKEDFVEKEMLGIRAFYNLMLLVQVCAAAED
ncbi:hypothetical protein Tco_0988845, partial [Tanacetum coccineum]